MNAVEIRIATAEDVPGLVAVLTGLFAEDPGTRDPSVSQHWPHRIGPSNVAAWMADANRLVLAAADSQAIAGILTGIITEPTYYRPVRVAILHSLYVDPAHRNDGVGADAIRFYQRHGFTPRQLEPDGEP